MFGSQLSLNVRVFACFRSERRSCGKLLTCVTRRRISQKLQQSESVKVCKVFLKYANNEALFLSSVYRVDESTLKAS